MGTTPRSSRPVITPPVSSLHEPLPALPRFKSRRTPLQVPSHDSKTWQQPGVPRKSDVKERLRNLLLPSHLGVESLTSAMASVVPDGYRQLCKSLASVMASVARHECPPPPTGFDNTMLRNMEMRNSAAERRILMAEHTRIDDQSC